MRFDSQDTVPQRPLASFLFVSFAHFYFLFPNMSTSRWGCGTSGVLSRASDNSGWNFDIYRLTTLKINQIHFPQIINRVGLQVSGI